MSAQEAIHAWLTVYLAQRLDVPVASIKPDSDIVTLGLDSVEAVRLSMGISDLLGIQLSPQLAYDYPRLERLVEHLVNVAESALLPVSSRLGPVEGEPVAIVGIALRFPGEVSTPEAFWRLLSDGVCAISPLPVERREGSLAESKEPLVGGFLNSISEFDATFFGISPKEAKYMDPQQRMLLEVGWQALEDAGHAGNVPRPLGVYVGMMNQHEYGKLQMQSDGSNYANNPRFGTGTSSSTAVGRLSTFLDAEGPSMTVDTACSSSLVAVHLACRSLGSGECDAALVAGVNAIVIKEGFAFSAKMGMLSSEGRSVPFDTTADGLVIGEGCGVVLLKRLSTALADGSTIYATIRGSAVNHDGIAHGMVTPNPQAQSAVIREALSQAKRHPSEVAYVEAHGASTQLGDRSELEALASVFDGKVRELPLLIGSVKANIGHLIGAAGIAGLIKTALCVNEGGTTPQPQATSGSPQPALALQNAKIATRGPWPTIGRARIAGVSSFGWGGTNAHVVLEEAPTCAAVDKGREVQLLVVSARTEDALEEVTKRLAEHLRERNLGLADVAYTLQMGRKAFEHRRAVVCRTVADAVAALESPEERVVTGKSRPEFGELEVSVDLDQLALRCRGGMPEEAARWEGMKQEERELGALLETVGRLWVAGARIEWDDMYGRERRRRVPLPTYPFERKRYWVETSVGGATPSMGLLAEEPEKKTEIADWFYVPSWKRSFVVGELRGEDGWWVLLGEGGGLAGGLAERLRGRGVQVVRVEAGERFAEIGEDRYTVRPTEREDYTAVLDAVRGRGGVVRRIVHLWLAAPAEMWHARGIDTMTAALDFGFHSLMALAQVLGEQPGEQHRLVILTSELQDVASGEVLCAEKAVVLGPCLVVPQEYAHIRCRSVDVDARDAEMPTEVFLERLERELTQEIDETVVALRGADRWVQEVAPARLSGGSGGAGLRQGGVYLITGGLGGIGMAVAEYLYRTVHARLVLVGRTAERNSAKVEALRSKGAEVLVQSADVGDRMQMEAVIEKAEERFGKVHGVIHTAGVPPSGLIQRKTREMAEEVMRPKLQGVLALAEVLRSRSLDFLCLFSSMSSMAGGGPGQVDYCAGNAFMDAFARQHFAECGMTFSIAWGEWQWNAWEDGLSGFPEEARQYFIEKRRAFGLSFEEGTEAFLRILNHRIPNTFVATQDFGQMVEGSKNFSIATILDAVTRMRGTRPTHPRPALAVSYVAPASEAERRLSRIWCDLLGFSEVGINDNFFDLGGNSLLGVDLIARISSDFELAVVPAHLLYEAPTIATLAGYLDQEVWRPDSLADRSVRGTARRKSLERQARQSRFRSG